MRMKRFTSFGALAALALMVFGCCASRMAPAPPAGMALQPGGYLTQVYRAADFPVKDTTFVLEPFTVETAQGVAPETFQTMLQTELTRAFEANGLKVAPQSDTVLTGTVQLLEIRGTRVRFVTGKITACLIISGAISRGGETRFAFQDRINLSSPINPGLAAPKERELLLNQAARTFAVHLLDELLLR